MVQIKLSNVIDGIASKLNTKARYSQFSEEYILSNVNVNKLKEIGFEFVGYDNANIISFNSEELKIFDFNIKYRELEELKEKISKYIPDDFITI